MDLRYQQEALDRFIDGRYGEDLAAGDQADEAELDELYALVREMRSQPEIEWPGVEFPVLAVARLSRALQGPAARSSAGFSDTAEFPVVARNGHLPHPPTLPNTPEFPDELAPRRTRAAWLRQWGQMAAAAVVLVLFATLLAVVLNDQATDDGSSTPGGATSTATAEAYVGLAEPPAIMLRAPAGQQAGGNGDYCWDTCEDLPGVALPEQPHEMRSGESLQLDFSNPGEPLRAMYGLFAYDQAVEEIDGKRWITTPADFATISSMQQLPPGAVIDLPLRVDPGHYVLVVTADYDEAGQRRLIQGFNLMVLASGEATSTVTPIPQPIDHAIWRSLQAAAGFDLYAPTWLPEGLTIVSPLPPVNLPGFTSAQLAYSHEGVAILRFIESSPFQAGPETMPSEQWSGSVEQEIAGRKVRIYESAGQVIAWWQEGDTSVMIEITYPTSGEAALARPDFDITHIIESMVVVARGESEPPVVPASAALPTEEHAIGRAREFMASIGGRADAALDQIRLTTLSEPLVFGLTPTQQMDAAAPVWWIEFADAFAPGSCPEAGQSVCGAVQAILVLDAVSGELLGWHGPHSQWQTTDSGASNLAPPDSDTPAVGTCAPIQGESVTITIHPDIPSPRCSFVGAEQWLHVVNDTDQAIDVQIAQFSATIPPGASHTFETPFGDYLAPGVHVVRTSMYPNGSGAELWLQE